MKSFSQKIFILLFLVCLTPKICLADEYEVVEHQDKTDKAFRWNVWGSEGPVYLRSSAGNSSAGNRFRLGGEFQLGEQYRWIVGVTALDFFSSGENASDPIGNISRDSLDFDAGYFLIPDRLWIKYSLLLGTVSSDEYIRSAGNIGQGLSVGYRFYNYHRFNISAELSYVYFTPTSVRYYDYYYQTLNSVTYPAANIISLNFRFGWDFWGQPE